MVTPFPYTYYHPEWCLKTRIIINNLLHNYSPLKLHKVNELYNSDLLKLKPDVGVDREIFQ